MSVTFSTPNGTIASVFTAHETAVFANFKGKLGNERMKKKVLGILLLALLLMGASALAEAIAPVPVEQSGYVAPVGMEGALTISQQSGSLTIAIDDSKVDWARAFASTGGQGDAQIIWQIKAPANARFVRMLQDPEDESAALDVLESSPRYRIEYNDSWSVPCEPTGMPITERGQTIATAILDMDYVVPQDVDTVIYVRWYDNDQNVLSTQKLNVSITHTKKQAFTAKTFIGAAEDRITPVTSDDVTLLEKKDGAVTYCVPASGTDVKTRVKAPAGAAQYAVYGNMKGDASDNAMPLADGYAEVTLTASDMVFTSTQTVYFWDASGKLLEMVTVSITIQPETEMKVWPAYTDAAFPMGESQLEIINDAASMGYTCTYDEDTGHLLCSFNGTQSTGGALKNLMTLQFKAPAWDDAVVTGYRIYQLGSNGLLGPNGGSLDKMLLELDRGYPNGPETASSGAVAFTDSYQPFRVIKPGADPSITLYVPDPSAMVENFVRLYVIEWNYEEGNPEYQYLYLTTEPFTVVQQTLAVSSAAQLPKPVEKPTVVMEGNLRLLVTFYITESDSAWHVELTLVDQQGNTVQPDGPVQVYLPFPDGHQSGDSYILHHYTNGLYDESALYNYNALDIQETEYGLMFETDSFSPFIYSRVSGDTPVTPDAPAAQLPQTGDDAPLTLWLSLVLLSAAAALLLWRSRKTA